MNDPVSFPCLLRVMGGWPVRITFTQVQGRCTFDGERCELEFRSGDREALVYDELHRIRVVNYEKRGAYVDLIPGRRGNAFRVWIREDEQSREAKAFVQYMQMLETNRDGEEEAAN